MGSRPTTGIAWSGSGEWGAVVGILTFLYDNGLWLSWPLFAAGVFLVVASIRMLLKLAERNRIHGVPLLVEQKIEFREAGRVELWLEGPLFSTVFMGLGYHLSGSGGQQVGSRRPLFPLHSAGFTRGRMLAWFFTIPSPGIYTLQVSGARVPSADDGRHELLFMRPHLPRTIGCILGIVLGAQLTIASLVNFLLRLTQGG